MPEAKSVTTPRTTIVNLKHSNADVNCGRGSSFGNPFLIGRDGTRDEVVEKYGPYFYKKLRNLEFRAKVIALKGKQLGCWCTPDRCHLEWIVEYLER
jgi:hypothetical protein